MKFRRDLFEIKEKAWIELTESRILQSLYFRVALTYGLENVKWSSTSQCLSLSKVKADSIKNDRDIVDINIKEIAHCACSSSVTL